MPLLRRPRHPMFLSYNTVDFNFRRRIEISYLSLMDSEHVYIHGAKLRNFDNII